MRGLRDEAFVIGARAGPLDVCVRERGRLSGAALALCHQPDLLAVAAERTHATSRSPRRARSHACLVD